MLLYKFVTIYQNICLILKLIQNCTEKKQQEITLNDLVMDRLTNRRTDARGKTIRLSTLQVGRLRNTEIYKQPNRQQMIAHLILSSSQKC